MRKSRETIAVFAGVAICIVLVTPFVMAIKYFDWGVGLVVISPPLIWLLLQGGKRLERWARNEKDTAAPDPDYPEDSA